MHSVAIDSDMPFGWLGRRTWSHTDRNYDRDRSETRYLPHAQRLDLDVSQATRGLVFNGLKAIQSDTTTTVDRWSSNGLGGTAG